MAKTLLRSGCLDDFLSLGENGQTVFDSALQIRETLRLRKLQAVVDSLAIAQPNDDGDRVDWYAPFEGTVTSWAAASAQQRHNALHCLENAQANVASLIECCQRAEKTAMQLFASLLTHAMQFPASQHVYLVDGKPVLTFWGFVNLNSSARPDPLDCLRITQPPEPIIEHLPEPEYVPPATPAPKRPHRRLIAGTLLLAAAITASFTYYVVSAPVPQPLVLVAREVQPQPVTTELTLPVDKAVVVEPQAPSPTPPTITKPVEVAKNALILPTEALKAGSTTFLNGNWRVLINVKDTITGKPPTLRYQIANNKGSVRLVHGDNVVCKAQVFSGLMQSGTLMIKSRGSAHCSDGSRYPLPEIACKPGLSDVAECSGRYEGDTVVPVVFKKVGD